MSIIIKPLTVTEIKNATPENSPLRDGQGLTLFITPTSKKWRLDYKRPITKKRTFLTLGGYPQISLKEARELRSFYKELIAKDIDPQEYLREKKLEKIRQLENTFYKAAVKWKAFKSQKVEEKTMNDDWRRLEKHIFPKLAHQPITKINARLLVEVLQPVYKKGQTSVIEKVLRSVDGIMDYAENTGIIDAHNCHKAKKAFHYKPATKNPTISTEEIPQFIRKIKGCTALPINVYLVFWTMLTGVRPAEAVAAEWAEIDFENRLWHIPKEKMKGRKNQKRPHTVPLSPQAIEILQKVKAFTGRYRFVFPSISKPYQPKNSESANNTMKRNGYKDKFTSHGMRALLKTWCAQNGVPAQVSEAILAHNVGNKLEHTYNRYDYLKERRTVMEQWGEFLAQNGLVWKE